MFEDSLMESGGKLQDEIQVLDDWYLRLQRLEFLQS